MVGSANLFRRVILPIFAGLIVAIGPNVAATTSLSKDEPGEKTLSVKAPVIVVGFVGGVVRANNAVHRPGQVAARVREGDPPGVGGGRFEDRRRGQGCQGMFELSEAGQCG